jgi:outer membrane murein-binding lipoprotein Lpp
MKKVILAAVLLAGVSITSCKSKASEDGIATDTDTMVVETDTVMEMDTITTTTDMDTVSPMPMDTVPK